MHLCVSVCVCCRWVIKSGNARSGSGGWVGGWVGRAVLMLHSGPSVPQQSKLVLWRPRQNRDNRALRDSQQAASSCALECCGCVPSTSTPLIWKMPWTGRTWLAAGGSALGQGDRQAVPCASKHISAHSEADAAIQTCSGSLHLPERPWMTSSDQHWRRETEWDASQQAPVIMDCKGRCKGSSSPCCLSIKCEPEVPGYVGGLLVPSESHRVS